MMNKKCVLILPYFGKFNNYFSLFLRSCGMNPDFDWLILTDCKENYEYPGNVRVVPMTLDIVKQRAEEKFGFKVCLKSPYKLCDYKPAYGFLFEDFIEGYAYWGHCDCDLIFGHMSKFLDPLFSQSYDKIFAAGHLTLYRNEYENNRRFMKEYKGHYIYKEAFTTDTIYVLDEDMRENNVHRLFLQDCAKVYQDDLSMNVSTTSHRIQRSSFNPQLHTFTVAGGKIARYYWDNGKIVECSYLNNSINYKDYLYMHLQARKMRIKGDLVTAELFEILPDRFVQRNRLPSDKKSMRLYSVRCTYWRPYDVLMMRIKRKMKKIRFAWF